jgi:hypothetical protein
MKRVNLGAKDLDRLNTVGFCLAAVGLAIINTVHGILIRKHADEMVVTWNKKTEKDAWEYADKSESDSNAGS